MIPSSQIPKPSFAVSPKKYQERLLSEKYRPGPSLHRVCCTITAATRKEVEGTEAQHEEKRPFKDQVFIRFLPGICVCMIWLYVVYYNHPPCASCLLPDCMTQGVLPTTMCIADGRRVRCIE